MAAMVRKLRVVLALAASLSVLPIGSALAADKWGAIAYSPSTSFSGSFLKSPTKDTAESKALTACAKQGKDCVIAVSFNNGCGAIAVGKKKLWAAGAGVNQSKAETAALAQCAKTDTGCKVVRWQCSQ